jgi:hypothetical protein
MSPNIPSDNRALTSLNLASNYLYEDGAKHVAEAIKVTKCVVVVVLTPVSCPSDHWFNCCCLLISPQDNGAMSELTFGDKEVVTMTIEMTEVDFSGKLYPWEARIVAAFIPKCT